MRIAVDWLRRSEIGEVIKTIVDAEKFPDYTIPKTAAQKHASQQAHDTILARFAALPFGRLWYGDTNAVANAIGHAEHYSRSHDAVIRVYDEAGSVIETHEHARRFHVSCATARDHPFAA